MNSKMLSGFCVLLVCCLLASAERLNRASANAVGSSGNGGMPPRRLLLAPHPIGRYNPRLSDGFLVQDDDVIELSKKQFDEYGHMRFGKREDQFDDYGHLRFGRADSE